MHTKGLTMKFVNKIIINTCVTLSITSISNLAHAALIKETWDFQVKYATGYYLTNSINDTFSIDFIYDDNGKFMHEYLADGTIIKNCNDTLIAGCDNTWTFYSLMADTNMSEIGFLFDTNSLASNGGSQFNINQSSKSWRFQTDPNISSITASERAAVVDDWFDVYLTDYQPSHMSDIAQFTFHYKNEFGGYQTSQYQAHISNITTSTVSVPEPTTLVTFSLGIWGLLSRRFI